MERHTLYIKQFTDIASLQSSQKISYSITCSETGLPYGVAIKRSGNTGAEEEFAAHIFGSRQDAEQLALFLYEKAVAPEHLYDILHDLKVSGSLKAST